MQDRVECQSRPHVENVSKQPATFLTAGSYPNFPATLIIELLGVCIVDLMEQKYVYPGPHKQELSAPQEENGMYRLEKPSNVRESILSKHQSIELRVIGAFCYCCLRLC